MKFLFPFSMVKLICMDLLTYRFTGIGTPPRLRQRIHVIRSIIQGWN